MMEEYYLPPFEKSINAGALTVMVNSEEVNGIPGHANKYLPTDILKDKWGLKVLQFLIGRTLSTFIRGFKPILRAKPLSPQP